MFLIGLGWSPLGLAAPTDPLPARSRYLLLDSRVVEKTENARLALGSAKKHPANPLFGEDKPWEARFDNLYANVRHDAQRQLYQCWYSPFILDAATRETPREQRASVRYRPRGREMGIGYAESKDGLVWEKPNLGLVEFQGNPANNLVLRGPHGAGVFEDRHDPDPQRRYKMFYQGMAVRFSADGLHWGDAVPCREIAARGDTHNNAFWAPELGRYIGITRLWDGQRIVGRTESKDFVKWTKAVEVLRGDPQNQTYAMPVFEYADVHLGLLMILRTAEDRVHCELAWSPDTVQWHRIEPGTPFIPNSPNKGDYDWGCVYAADDPVVLADEIQLYYGGSNGPHTSWRDGFLCLATLRRDRWAGYEPSNTNRSAIILTKPIVLSTSTLRVTADARGGSAVVAILDVSGRELAAAEAITGEVTDSPVRLATQAVLTELKGKPVRLQFNLQRAKLYSFTLAE